MTEDYTDSLGNKLSDPPHLKRSLIENHPYILALKQARLRPVQRDEGYDSPSAKRITKGNQS